MEYIECVPTVKIANIEIDTSQFCNLKFKIGNNTESLSDWNDIILLKNSIDNFIKYTESWGQIIYYYENLSIEKIKKKLDDDFELTGVYNVGENFARYTEDYSGTLFKIVDNISASKKIQNKYYLEYGQNSLEFKPEMDYCYVYTKNREEAIRFIMWTVETIIFPVLDKIRNNKKS